MPGPHRPIPRLGALLLCSALLAPTALAAQGGQDPGPYPILLGKPGDELPPGMRGTPNL